MAKILILKGDNPNEKSECYKTYQGLSEIGLDEYYIVNYRDIFIEMTDKGTAIYFKDDESDNSVNLVDFDVVYIRDFHGYEPERNSIAHYLKSNKIKFVNSDIAEFQSISKLEQCIKFSLNNISIPKSVYVNKNHALDIINEYFKYPFIMKSIYGNSGKNNYLVNNYDEFVQIINTIDEKMIFQEYIPNKGDYRIVVVGDSISTIVHRESHDKKDHRNNISLGGTKTYLEIESIDSTDKELAINAAMALNREICGVDLIKCSDTGKSYILEVNFNFGIKSQAGTIPKELYGLAKYIHDIADSSIT